MTDVHEEARLEIGQFALHSHAALEPIDGRHLAIENPAESGESKEIDAPCPPGVPPWLKNLHFHGDFLADAAVGIEGAHLEGVFARR